MNDTLSFLIILGAVIVGGLALRWLWRKFK